MWRSLNIAKKIYFSIALIIAGYSLSMVYVFIDGHAARERLDNVAFSFRPPAEPHGQ